MKQIIIDNAQYWLDDLENRAEDDLLSEIDVRNVAQALEAVMTVPEAWPLTLSLALALHPRMERRGYWSDWEDFLRGLITLAHQRADSAAEADLLISLGAVRRERGNHQAAIVSYRQAWRLCRQAGDQRGRARTLSNLGYLYRLQGRFLRAEALCQGALTLFQVLGDTMLLARTENHLGLVYFDQGRWSEALSHLNRSKTLLQQIGDWHSLAKTLRNLGELYRLTGESENALDYFGQAIRHSRAVGDENHAARIQLNVGNVYLNRGDLLLAEMTYSQAEAILERGGDSLYLARIRHNLGMVYTRLEHWPEAASCFERVLEQWRNLEDTWNLANTLGELARMHYVRGHWDQAQARLDEAWGLVCEQREPHYEPLRRELVELQQELHGASGAK